MTDINKSLIDLNWHPLSKEEIRHFDDHGYLIVRNVLDSDTIGFRSIYVNVTTSCLTISFV